MTDNTADSADKNMLLARLADEFATRIRAGERPALKEYIDRYPALADEIGEVFPAMVEIEQFKDDHEELTFQAAVPLSPALEQLGDFRIIREVGKGGMGIVYEAEQVSLGRHVALKVLPKRMLIDPKARRRFEREAKSAAKLHHTNIVPVFGVGEQDGMPYYVMQFIQGLGLDEVLAELKKLHRGNRNAGTFAGGELRVSRNAAQGSSPTGEAGDVKTRSHGSLAAANVARSLLTGEFQSPDDQTDDVTTTVPVEKADAEDHPAAAPRSPALSDSFTPSSSSVILPGQSRDGSKSRRRKQTYWQSVASIGVQIAGALEYAHKQGVQHRDIKPSNLLLDTQGTAWVTDFGLAKADDQQNLTHTGDILGTLRYMPPEAFEGKGDARSDVYSLGLTLYEMVAFRPAFDEKDRNRLIKQVTSEEPARLRKLNPHVPQDLETILHKAIDKDPVARYVSAGALAEDLERYLDDEPIHARRVRHAERLWRWCKRNPALAAASGVAAAGLLAVTVFAILFAFVQANNAAREARSNVALITEQFQTRAEKVRAEELLAKSEKLAADLSAALTETKTHEAMLAVEKGHTLISQGQLYPGMLWMARGLERAPADAISLQDSIRTSLAALRSDVPALRLVLPTPGGAIAVAFSPDSKKVATGGGPYGGKGQARLWDAATGQPLGPPLPHEHQVLSVAFAPDGKTVLTGSGDYRSSAGQAQLWEVASGKPLGKPLPHQNAVWSLAFSPDGKTIVTGTLELTAGKGEARLWDAATGKPQGQPLAQIGAVYRVAFCPDGKAVVTASWNSLKSQSEVRLWDSATGRPIGEPLAVTGPVFSVAPSPDGKTIVTGGFDLQTLAGEVRFWNRTTGAPIGQPLPLAHMVSSVALSSDGRMLLTGTSDYASRKGEIQLWEVATRKPLGPPIIQQERVDQAAVSPDGRAILAASGAYGQPSYLWELATDRLVGPPLFHPERVSAVAFSPVGRLVVTGTGMAGKRGAAHRWDWTKGRPIGPPLRAAGYVLAVAFSCDGTRLVTGSGYLGENKGEAQLWDPDTGNPIGRPLAHGNDVTAVAFSPDGKRVLTGSLDRTARLWDAASGKAIGRPFVHPASVTSVAYSPDGKTILTGYGKQARLWDVATAKPSGAPLDHQATVTGVTFSPTGETFATACQDRLVLLRDTPTAKPRGLPLQHPDAVTAVVFSPDGKLLATGCKDQTARMWDAYTGLPVGMGLRHPKTVTSVAFGPDGQTILTGCEDGVARLWDAGTLVTGENARLVRWVQVQSGMELSPEGAVRTLDDAAREERRQSLAKLGGPLTGRPEQNLARHLRQALLCLDAQDWRAATWHLDRQLRDHPRDALALALRTRAHLEEQQLDLAAEDFRRALALGPPEIVLPCFRAFAADAIERKHGQRALWFLDRLVEADPRNAFAWLSRGRLAAEQGQWQKAAGDMARGLDLDPVDSGDWHQAIPLQLYCGDLGAYRRLCHAALDRFGDTAEPTIAEQIATVCLLMPSAVEDRERPSRLADRSVASGYRHGFLPFFELAKGIAEYREGRFSAAVDWLQKSREFPIWSKELATQSFMAMAYHRLGQFDKARQAMEKARQLLEQAPKPGQATSPMPIARFYDPIIGQLCYREAAAILDVPHRREAEASLKKHEWSDAVVQLTHLIETDPGFWADWVSRSCAAAELGRHDDASADFTHALELAHNRPDPWVKRGLFHAELGRTDKAAAEFVRALEVMPEGPDGENERSAICRDLLAMPGVLVRVMELRPKDGDLYLARARAHAERKAWDEAIRDYDRAAELKPDDLRLRLDRARCRAILGRFVQAASDYAKGLESRPDDVLLWHEAAMAHLAAGKHEGFGRICARMWDKFGKTVNSEIAQRAVFTIVLAARPIDTIPMVDLEMYGPGDPAFGAVLYRDGKWEEAVRELEQSALKSVGFHQAWCWMFLAMAHGRLGHAATAREFLENGRRWIDGAGANELDSLNWTRRVELQTLRREAEELLNEKGSAARR
jgi:WD40 repeat protein/serine/threonine protein kinase/tetratricopeptide (TPR) repeat protein